MDDLPYWYHPFRMDAWPEAMETQRASLRKLIARDRDDPADIEAVYKEVLEDDEARRDPNDAAIIGLLQLVRNNHLMNEGCIFDMYRLWSDFSATDSGTVDLSRVKLHSNSVYYHFGTDILLDPEKAPDTCFEGAYVSRGEGRWFITFVFDYPDWETEIGHERTSVAEQRMARAFMVEFPDGIPAGAVPDHLMDFHGDEIAGADPKLQWMLVNIVLNAMMYFGQDYVDVFESRFDGQWGRALKPNVYDCGQPRMFKREPPFIAGNWMHHQRTDSPGISTIWNMPRWGVERPSGPRRGESEDKVVQLFGRNAKA
ncbi:hypothetical protein [Rhizobium leguminosarum]|jgi:hypothetical protein|uniref:hypothetical protein n=1 Tax=Rhizobium leguminosarum TaxID=384 RepID=UPI0015F799D3|nr:hypothetical protein [Rhizobium leguminosarum]MBA8835434.1 hypothetical protein [Rhizobium leguminosarum]